VSHPETVTLGEYVRTCIQRGGAQRTPVIYIPHAVAYSGMLVARARARLARDWLWLQQTTDGVSLPVRARRRVTDPARPRLGPDRWPPRRAERRDGERGPRDRSPYEYRRAVETIRCSVAPASQRAPSISRPYRGTPRLPNSCTADEVSDALSRRSRFARFSSDQGRCDVSATVFRDQPGGSAPILC
jgi:hypothetical protein